MPSGQQHRGKHPQDSELFAPEQHPALRRAVADLSWLLSRGYALTSSLKLTGDRYELRERQRMVVSRAAATDEQCALRAAKERRAAELAGETVLIDGFNLIIGAEAMLGSAVIYRCRDQCLRDLCSVHGSWHRVEETDRAIGLIGAELAALHPAEVVWYLDQPVSNSGRLAQRLRTFAEEHGWPWRVETVMSPDHTLRNAQSGVAVTSDSAVLDECPAWFNFCSYLLRKLEAVQVVDLSQAEP